MSRFKFVTFDVTHTLLKFHLSVGEVYTKAASAFGLELCKETVDVSFRNNFKLLLKQHPNFGASTNISSEEWWSLIVGKTLMDSMSDQLKADKETLNKIAKHLFHLYSKKDCWTVLPGITGLLTKLKNRDVKLGVISNFDERLEEVLISNRLRPYFDVVLASYCVNMEKPNKEIFDLAIEKIGNSTVKPCESLHIGDNVQLDYEGATKAGWNSLLLVNPNKKGEITKYNVAYSVVDIERHILK